MEIVQAKTDRHYDLARTLFEEYVARLDVDLDFQDFGAELQTLDRMYAPPHGCILLALDGKKTAGCVAVRALPAVGEDACEMKRLYVVPSYRGRGLGRRLAEAVLEEGRRLGYSRMLLDTLERMERARALYHKLGFREVKSYYHNPLGGVQYMEVQLKPSIVT